MRRGRRDSSNGDLAKTGGGRFCTVKWPVLGAYRDALGVSWEVGGSCGLEREGLEKEVLYPPKWCRFDAEKNKIKSNRTVWNEPADLSGSLVESPIQSVRC